MLIRVRDDVTGKIYSNDMSEKNDLSILEIHFCTSYTQVEVQDKINNGKGLEYPTHTICIQPLGTKPNWVDLIAIQDSNAGSWIVHKTKEREMKHCLRFDKEKNTIEEYACTDAFARYLDTMDRPIRDRKTGDLLLPDSKRFIELKNYLDCLHVILADVNERFEKKHAEIEGEVEL